MLIFSLNEKLESGRAIWTKHTHEEGDEDLRLNLLKCWKKKDNLKKKENEENSIYVLDLRH